MFRFEGLASETLENVGGEVSLDALEAKRRSLQKQLADSSERLRKLKMVRMYRSKVRKRVCIGRSILWCEQLCRSSFPE